MAGLDAAPGGLLAKSFPAKLLRTHPEFAAPERRESLLALLCDLTSISGAITGAGWSLLMADGTLPGAADAMAALAARLESDRLVLGAAQRRLRRRSRGGTGAADAVAGIGAPVVGKLARTATSSVCRATPAGSAQWWGMAFDDDERACLESDDGPPALICPCHRRASPAKFSDP